MTPEERLDRLVERARRSGAPEWEVFLLRRSSTVVAAKDGRVDQVRRSDETTAAVRLIDDGRQGFAYTSDFDERAVARTIDQAAVGMWLADHRPGLALPDPPEGGYPAVDEYDPGFEDAVLEAKQDRALALEAAARQHDRRIQKVRAAEYRESASARWIRNSRGIDVRDAGTAFTASITAKAAQGDQAEQGSASNFARRRADLDPEDVGRRAARRAVNALGARPVAGDRRAAVVLDPETAADFVQLLAQSFSAENVRKGKSMLAGRTGQRVAGSLVTITDDGRRPRGAATAAFDGEGVPRRTTPLIEAGLLKEFLFDTQNARLMNAASTGNAARPGATAPPGLGPSNLILAPGDHAPDRLIADAGKGLLVTDVMGLHTANPVTGDFSVGAAGMLISDGQIDHPVKGMALAGNLLDLFDRVVGLGSDFRLYGRCGAPSLLVDGLVLSGL